MMDMNIIMSYLCLFLHSSPIFMAKTAHLNLPFSKGILFLVRQLFRNKGLFKGTRCLRSVELVFEKRL